MRRRLASAAALLLAGLPCAAGAEDKAAEDGTVVAALKQGKLLLDVRYRLEWKDQRGFAADAYANTIRTRLGYETGEFHHFKALVEFENVASIGDDHFNSTTNGRVQHPIIADPDATELNRAQVTFTGIDGAAFTIGRQRINLANQRFVGAVDFRQNEQTFDAARAAFRIGERLTAEYAYISRVHRVFGDDHPLGEFDSDSHLFAAAYDGKALGRIAVYGLVLDFEEAPALSSSTFGIRYENSHDLADGVRLTAAAEYASQSDHAGNPFDYRESYAHGEAALSAGPFAGRIGYERLGGDGAVGFSTPLATLHKFQGFADVFLATPAAGVEDFYGGASAQWKNGPLGLSGNVFAVYHAFESAMGGADFGDEIDAGVALTVRKRWSAEIKGAVYRGAGAFADRSLVWASLRFQY
jgi:hypothetical protein